MKRFTRLTAAVLAAGSFNAVAGTTYQTVDVAAAIGHGISFLDGYIHGDGTDSVDPSNTNGSLSVTGSFTQANFPFAASYLTAQATWDNFRVAGNSVNVLDFDLTGTVKDTNGLTWTASDVASAPRTLTANLDGTMFIDYTARFESGPFDLEVNYVAGGGYVVNDANSGLQSASASQFGFLGPFAQGAADYLNEVVANYFPNNWTHGGLWLFADDYTTQNTSGNAAANLIGNKFQGYNIWYSTDSFLFGQELTDSDDDGFFSNEEVQALIDNNEFPEIAGLNLAGDGFAQLYEVELIEGEGAVQTVIFDYDDSVIDPADEPLLTIVHYTNGQWETPDQVLDTVNNQITVTVDNFSPFALVTVPIPGAVYLLGSAVVLLGARMRRRS